MISRGRQSRAASFLLAESDDNSLSPVLPQTLELGNPDTERVCVKAT